MVVKPQCVKWEFLDQPATNTILQTNPFVFQNKNIKNEFISKEDLKLPEKNMNGECIIKKVNEAENLQANVKDKAEETITNQDSLKTNTFKALKIEFDLPSSSYATIALRQIFRRNFDKFSQKTLENC